MRTDLLVSVRCLDGISHGPCCGTRSVAVSRSTPRSWFVNPRLWLHLDRGARKAADDGHLLCGATVLGRISRRVDRETAQAVFKASGLE